MAFVAHSKLIMFHQHYPVKSAFALNQRAYCGRCSRFHSSAAIKQMASSEIVPQAPHLRQHPFEIISLCPKSLSCEVKIKGNQPWLNICD